MQMVEFVKAYPDIKFLVFTKQYDIVNSYPCERDNMPANFSIVFSAWPGLPMNNPKSYPVAYMQDGTETRVNGKEIECPGNCETCGACFSLAKHNLNVVFDKH